MAIPRECEAHERTGGWNDSRGFRVTVRDQEVACVRTEATPRPAHVQQHHLHQGELQHQTVEQSQRQLAVCRVLCEAPRGAIQGKRAHAQ